MPAYLDEPNAEKLVRKLIRKLEENFYDIILMDVQMPEMDGYGTTNFIRNKKSAIKQADLQNLPELMTAMHTSYEVSVNELKSTLGNFHLKQS